MWVLGCAHEGLARVCKYTSVVGIVHIYGLISEVNGEIDVRNVSLTIGRVWGVFAYLLTSVSQHSP